MEIRTFQRFPERGVRKPSVHASAFAKTAAKHAWHNACSFGLVPIGTNESMSPANSHFEHRGAARLHARRAVGFLTALVLSTAFARAADTSSEALEAAADAAVALVRALPVPAGARLEAQALPFDPRVAVTTCAKPLAAELVGKRLAGSRVSVRVRCADDARPWSIAAALRVSLFQPVLIAKQALVRGDTVGPDTTEIAERDVLALGYGHLDDPARYAGSRILRPVAAGAALSPGAVAAPLLVERGGTVTLIARGPAIDVRASGVAMEDGSAGARVHVRNASSGRTVSGVVDGPGQVSIER